MFSIAFMVVVFVLGNPETQTVSHSFPKLCAALQRKFRGRGGGRAGIDECPAVSECDQPSRDRSPSCNLSWALDPEESSGTGDRRGVDPTASADGVRPA
jgi:hypothetical protein